MPKRVSAEAKRVPLNCLVLPETLEYLKSSTASQGVVVDMAVAALKTQEAQGRVMAETGDPWKAISVREIATTIPPCSEPCEHLSCEMQREPSESEARKRHVQNWKRGPQQKGDKTR